MTVQCSYIPRSHAIVRDCPDHTSENMHPSCSKNPIYLKSKNGTVCISFKLLSIVVLDRQSRSKWRFNILIRDSISLLDKDNFLFWVLGGGGGGACFDAGFLGATAGKGGGFLCPAVRKKLTLAWAFCCFYGKCVIYFFFKVIAGESPKIHGGFFFNQSTAKSLVINLYAPLRNDFHQRITEIN